MKIHRIYAMLLRHFYILRRSWNRISETFYWPIIDLILWGFTSTYIKFYAPGASKIVLILVSGILFWTIVWRGQLDIDISFLEEVWNKNFVNLFVAPLRFIEWIISIIIVGILKTCISFICAVVFGWFLYKVNIFFYGLYLIPFIFLLLMFAWSIGFFIAGLLLRYSTKFETIAWSIVGLISPFSGVFYPLAILPLWAQKVALIFPSSYIFEGIREFIQKGTVDSEKLYISFVLDIVYLLLSIIYLKTSFNKVLQKGLVKVY